MKENFERILKESLENYELPYDNSAWEQFSKRLDGTPSTPFYRKWWFAASVGTILVGSATYFMWTSSNQPASSVNSPKETVSVVSKGNTPENSTQTANTHNTVSVAALPIQVSPQPIAEATIVNRNPAPESEMHIPLMQDIVQDEWLLPAMNQTDPQETPVQFNTPALPKSVCINEPFELYNPNAKATLNVFLPNGKKLLVQPNEKIELNSSVAGSIAVTSGSYSETIAVNQSTLQLYIDADQTTFLNESSVPTMKFVAKGVELPVNWETSIAYTSQDKNELTVHPFVETDFQVTAIAKDPNGCTVRETKTVHLDNTYNLVATSGFAPTDPDPRNNTFMPYALAQRDTPFELVILDPKNMQQVFKSGNAGMGWNGMDSRTGQMVALNSTWLWIVVMKNPLPGEPKEYRGWIMCTSSR